MAMTDQPPKSLGDKLLSIPKSVLYAVLFLGASIPLFIPVQLPNQPKDESTELYSFLMSIPAGSSVIVQTDWTNSTRGESLGEFDAVLRILMRQHIKVALMSVADPQAPQTARNAIADLNKQAKLDGQEEFKRWEDWIDLGFFPNAEGIGNSIGANIRNAFSSLRDVNTEGHKMGVFSSPVLQNIQKVGDLKAFIVITGTSSITAAIQRLSKKVSMAGAVTGVMGPETLNYFQSGQLKGLAVGIKGVYDMETLMQNGVSAKNLPPLKGTNLDKGPLYFLTVHVTAGLLILAVIIGNVGVFLNRRKS